MEKRSAEEMKSKKNQHKKQGPDIGRANGGGRPADPKLTEIHRK